jgi:hypothetical protein
MLPFKLHSPFIAEASLKDVWLTACLADDTHGEGFEWMIVPTEYSDTEDHPTVYSVDVNSEKQPYPTLESAMQACWNYYTRIYRVSVV